MSHDCDDCTSRFKYHRDLNRHRENECPGLGGDVHRAHAPFVSGMCQVCGSRERSANSVGSCSGCGVHTSAGPIGNSVEVNPPDRVWIVMGESGSYDEWEDWPVCFYDTEAEATAHAEAAKAMFAEHATFVPKWNFASEYEGFADAIAALRKELDPTAHGNMWDGLDYTVVSAPRGKR